MHVWGPGSLSVCWVDLLLGPLWAPMYAHVVPGSLTCVPLWILLSLMGLRLAPLSLLHLIPVTDPMEHLWWTSSVVETYPSPFWCLS